MKTSIWLVASLLSLGTTACVNLERSRDLANADVAPQVTARQVCSNCHGVDGNSVSPNFPRLAGQQSAYIVAQLQNFRSKQRSDPAGFYYMWGISRNLTDGQIQGLADYYAQQTPTPNPSADTARLTLGKDIFENGITAEEVPACKVCHGAHAEGLATFPRLAGQHQDYLVKQLNIFQSTEGRPETPMKQVSHLLTSEQMRAVAAYLQALPSAQL